MGKRPPFQTLQYASQCLQEEYDGNYARTAKALGIPRTTLQSWIELYERETAEREQYAPEGRKHVSFPDGVGIVGSDFHYWPDSPDLMHRAFIWAIKEFSPKLVVLNGDVLDFNSISRHPPIGWEAAPDVQEEIEGAQDKVYEIESAIKKGTKKIWTLGNHDARFETKMASTLPQYRGVKGIHLKDHFPNWTNAWSVWVNDDLVIKHRYKGGIHAPHNNTMWAGKSMITGHLHSAKVVPFSDYNGTRYGVDAGTVSDIWSPCFQGYLEDNPRNWRSGFCIFTYLDGKLLMPELVTLYDEDHVQFRGKKIRP